jgi:hypothetical protein
MRIKDIAAIVVFSILYGFLFAVIFGLFSGFNFFSISWIIFSAILVPIIYFCGKKGAKCNNCGAAWSLSGTIREDIRTDRTFEIVGYGDDKKKVWKDVHHYWQYFECDKCRDVTRARFTTDSIVGEEHIF